MDENKTPAMTPQQEKLTHGSVIKMYREMVAGGASFLEFLYYEITQTLFSGLGGALGMGLRYLTFPALFKSCGKKTVFGRGLILRCPKRVSLGKKCLIDDLAVIDARGEKSKIVIGDFVSIGRGSAIVAKDAEIKIADGVNIGCNVRIATQSKITIEESVLIAANVYIGPGNHKKDDGTPLISCEMDLKGGVTIGKNAWIGTGVTILDGVTIGEGAIVGAHALVRHDVPAGKTVVGVPAKVLEK